MATATTRMPTELAEAHRLIGNELHFLYTKWNYYKRLFCTDDETVRLLCYAAEFFFRIYREVIRDDLILTLCRLTDPPTTRVKGRDKPNLTLKYLVGLIPDSDDCLRQALGPHLKSTDSRIAKFRQHRNRRIGHFDLAAREKRTTALLPDLGLDETADALAAIAKILNDIEQFYDQDEQSYEEGIHGSGNAEDLVEFIKEEQKSRKCFNEKESGD